MALLQARPDLRLVVTANTLTGRQLVRDWRLDRVTARLAPLDTGPALRSFLTRWRPAALISLEAEYWPRRLTCGLPVTLLGARMSDRAFLRWHKRPALAARMLAGVRLASAQDARSHRHLLALGLDPEVMLPDLDLKAQAVALLPTPETPNRADRATWLLAASTHDGEEALILRAFTQQTQFTHQILAPRHPTRASAIAAQIRSLNLSFDQRSLGADPGQAQVYLADTLGEMDLWYARCGAAIIGGSFADRGGHTPWEPARFATALLHGPSTRNFAAAFAALDAAGAALPVNADTLAPALSALHADAQNRLATAATSLLHAQCDFSETLTRLLTVSRL
jgi:3-deoxy-D-manno-octulosonic-acid transferase